MHSIESGWACMSELVGYCCGRGLRHTSSGMFFFKGEGVLQNFCLSRELGGVYMGQCVWLCIPTLMTIRLPPSVCFVFMQPTILLMCIFKRRQSTFGIITQGRRILGVTSLCGVIRLNVLISSLYLLEASPSFQTMDERDKIITNTVLLKITMQLRNPKQILRVGHNGSGDVTAVNGIGANQPSNPMTAKPSVDLCQLCPGISTGSRLHLE